MEAGSDGNSPAPAADGSKKPKRQMKTPFQLEILERTYKEEVYPTEATRLQLSEELGLTERQVQMWFCHRRLKDKKRGTLGGKTEFLESSRDDLMVPEHDSYHGSRSRSRSESRSRSGSGSGSGSSQFENGDDVALVTKGYRPSPLRIVRRVIDCVEEQLGESVREDGPVLGMVFDDLPPGAFGTPIEGLSLRASVYQLFCMTEGMNEMPEAILMVNNVGATSIQSRIVRDSKAFDALLTLLDICGGERISCTCNSAKIGEVFQAEY